MGRTMSVKVDGSRSTRRAVNAGAPQGSVLGTYIFNVGTDSLEDGLRDNLQEFYELRAADLSFLELAPTTTYAESTPTRARFPPSIDLSPVDTTSQQPVLILPRARNVPPNLSSRRIEPTWRQKPVTVKKFVDDNLQNEKVSMRQLPTYEMNGITYKNARAGRSEDMFRHISAKAHEQGLRVNTDKTTLLAISGAISYEARAHLYDSQNTRIDSTDTLKVLGFTFNKTGTIHDQVEILCKRFRARTWALRDLRKSGFTQEELLRVYTTTIRPIIEYSSVVYHSMLSKEQSDYIEKQQCRALKNIYGSDISHAKLIEISGLPLLEQRRQQACLKFATKMSNNPRFAHHFRKKKSRSRAGTEEQFIELPSRTHRRFNSPLYHFRRILNCDTTRYF